MRLEPVHAREHRQHRERRIGKGIVSPGSLNARIAESARRPSRSP
jgi:hypothetical protein